MTLKINLGGFDMGLNIDFDRLIPREKENVLN